eukprot:scaffold122982_cov22-Tisochrysis_lutea.AAC.2
MSGDVGLGGGVGLRGAEVAGATPRCMDAAADGVGMSGACEVGGEVGADIVEMVGLVCSGSAGPRACISGAWDAGAGGLMEHIGTGVADGATIMEPTLCAGAHVVPPNMLGSSAPLPDDGLLTDDSDGGDCALAGVGMSGAAGVGMSGADGVGMSGAAGVGMGGADGVGMSGVTIEGTSGAADMRTGGTPQVGYGDDPAVDTEADVVGGVETATRLDEPPGGPSDRTLLEVCAAPRAASRSFEAVGDPAGLVGGGSGTAAGSLLASWGGGDGVYDREVLLASRALRSVGDECASTSPPHGLLFSGLGTGSVAPYLAAGNMGMAAVGTAPPASAEAARASKASGWPGRSGSRIAPPPPHGLLPDEGWACL